MADAGLLMAPRGVGTMAAMLIAGRLSARYDPRILMAIGLLILIYSMWMMTAWTPDVSQFDIIVCILLQGAGLGLVFIPLQVLSFGTLPAHTAPTAPRCSACSAMSAARSAFPSCRRRWRATTRCCTSRSAPP